MAEIEHDGCDCTELCAMGPTCPGGSLAGLPGSGCSRINPPSPDLLAALGRAVEAARQERPTTAALRVGAQEVRMSEQRARFPKSIGNATVALDEPTEREAGPTDAACHDCCERWTETGGREHDHACSEREAGEADAAVAWIKRLVGAWDCCAACAGGVLAERDRRLRAEAWDEGYFLGVGLPAELGHTFRNPYRGDA